MTSGGNTQRRKKGPGRFPSLFIQLDFELAILAREE